MQIVNILKISEMQHELGILFYCWRQSLEKYGNEGGKPVPVTLNSLPIGEGGTQ